MLRCRALRLPLVVVLVAVLGMALAQTGFIQVRAQPGIQVFLDGVFVGVTNADVGGLILTDVRPGERQLRFVREGFLPQDATVSVVAGQVLLYEVASLVPRVQVREEGAGGAADLEAEIGSVVVQCLPIECVVDIPALGIVNRRKTQDRLVLDGVPVGEYHGRLSVGTTELPVSFVVCASDTLSLFGTFVGSSTGVQVTSEGGFGQDCARAAAVDTDLWVERFAAAVALMNAGRVEDAVGPLEEGARLAPDNADVRMALATAYTHLGRLDDALVTGHEALARAESPEAQAQALHIIGRALYLQGDYAGAAAEFAMVVQMQPGSAMAQLWAGLAHYQLGDFERAALFYERSIQLDPNAFEARVNLGAAYLATKRYRDAEGVYRLLVQQNARDAESLYYLGWALYAQHKYSEARSTWGQACELGQQPACSAPGW